MWAWHESEFAVMQVCSVLQNAYTTKICLFCRLIKNKQGMNLSLLSQSLRTAQNWYMYVQFLYTCIYNSQPSIWVYICMYTSIYNITGVYNPLFMYAYTIPNHPYECISVCIYLFITYMEYTILFLCMNTQFPTIHMSVYLYVYIYS